MSKSGAGGKLVDDGDEECPVCHSRRYLNKNIKFKINPECYHKICDSCVERIFSHGPAMCPIAKCGKTLRKFKFREPTFEDLRLEREVDIRRRVSTVFNREERDFETLRDYNDYLNDVEDSIYNLIYGIDIEATEKKMQDYQAANRQAIEDNLARAKQGSVDFNKHREAEKRAERARWQMDRDAEETERRIKEREKRELFEKIEAGGDADALIKQANQVTLRRAKKLRREAQESENADAKSAVVIKGLKKHVEPEVEKENPYDPFGGMDDRREYYQIYEQYRWQAFDNLTEDEAALAGGISFHEHRERALCDAFSGLGVIIGDELSTEESMADPAINTSDGATGDVF